MADEMQSLESKVPWRHLVGLEHRLKDEDCVKARIGEDVRVKGRAVNEAFATMETPSASRSSTRKTGTPRARSATSGSWPRTGSPELSAWTSGPGGRAQGNCQLLARAAIRGAVGSAVPHPPEL